MQPDFNITSFLQTALTEDIGTGDVTSMATIPEDLQASFVMNARAEMVVAGLVFLPKLFELVSAYPRRHPGLEPGSKATTESLSVLPETPASAGVTVELLVGEGEKVSAGTSLARLSGPARALLSGERTALNLVQQLSGVATLTRAYVEAVAGTGAVILDTRKTIPGLRNLQKYAVKCGGGQNHRMGLYDAVLIKDNHIAVAGGVAKAVAAAKEYIAQCPSPENPKGIFDLSQGRGDTAGALSANGEAGSVTSPLGEVEKCPSLHFSGEGPLTIEVECDTLGQLDQALAAGVDVVLLDNMNNAQLREAVAKVRAHNAATGQGVKTEASGNVSLATVRGIAETGVDYISVGKLTHSAPAVDVGLDEG